MLVSPAPVLPAGEGWAFEVKWDGMRALVCAEPAIRVRSRHGHDHTAAFPELAALRSLSGRASVVLDGELLCLDPITGRPSFERLMARTQARLPALSARQHPATFIAFDVLVADGIDVCRRPWAERRELLENLHNLAADGRAWRVSTAFTDGPGLLAATAAMGLEGVVAKPVTSCYWPGRRTPFWRKVKHRTYEWFDLLRWRGTKGPGPRWPAGRAGGQGHRPRVPGAPISRTPAARFRGWRSTASRLPAGCVYRRAERRSRSGSWNGCPPAGCGNRWPAPRGP
jgi:bifunctional non-homologous end joining protein LigD